MNINSISGMNFQAHINRNDYFMGKIEEYLYENHGHGADEFIDFEKKLSELPEGTVDIDEFVHHAGKSYVFGTLYPTCNHPKPFIAETADTQNLLDEIIEKVASAFKEKSSHPECPNCNPSDK